MVFTFTKLIPVLVKQLNLLIEELLSEICWMPDAFKSLSNEILQVRVDSSRIALDNQVLKAGEVRVQ